MEILRAGSEKNWIHNNMFIMCNFNMNCNFKCSYCYNEDLKSQYSKPLSEKAVRNLIPGLSSLKKEFYTFGFGGGEPTLYPYFQNFFSLVNEYFCRDNHLIVINTNGFLLNSLTPYFENFSNVNIKISVSVHNEQMSFEQYLFVLKSFKFPERCMIKIMLKPGELKKTKLFVEQLKEINFLNIGIRSLLIDKELHPDYTEEEREFFREENYALKTKIFGEYRENETIKKISYTLNEFRETSDLVNYKNLFCSAGYNGLRIFPDGSVSTCMELPAVENFNLNDNSILEFPYLKKPMICSANKCLCTPFTALPKWKSQENIPNYMKNSLING